ncbi:TIGR01459 family HAD-type hydrolase [Parvularcula sp. LCG005]|uniref:TIGR01459 family HAD-type hydrolase n=1 Tax=Parvularcula sp. LCG005 TaxID=3078805 RepID=UPI00294279A0|nr:TIGR01459 family HAD-type hydrolase [Parvularcula sp. LCG005]WOI52807.1 TIGR01459 family HAD-type hydrolase [Parvularcula sp. LCG005]
MTEPRALTGLSQIADQYDAVLCDAWGVVHNGQRLYDGVGEALTQFQATRGPVIILTNAPRLSDVIPAQLDSLGLSRDAYTRVVTSGDATRAAVTQRADSAFFKLGPSKDETLFSALPISFVPLDEADVIVCTGLFNEMTETPEDYRDMLKDAARRNIPMICANPDKVVKLGDQLIYCAGAIADVYAELGGNVIYGGKPHAPIYELSRDVLRDKGLPADARLLAIGDGVQTDILGANEQNIDVVFVAEGIFSEESRDDSGHLDTGKLAQLLKKHGVHAEYAMDGLVW